MKKIMTAKKVIVTLIFLFLLSSIILCQETLVSSDSNTNIIYGKNHVFAINTPLNWINDKDVAINFGLRCFFYPSSDSIGNLKSYMYAMGIDKLDSKVNIDGFITEDLKKFSLKYPDFNYEIISTKNSVGILNSRRYLYSNLEDRYKEVVLYYETDSSNIIITFSAFNQQDYNNYIHVFDSLISSFKYMGNNYIDKK